MTKTEGLEKRIDKLENEIDILEKDKVKLIGDKIDILEKEKITEIENKIEKINNDIDCDTHKEAIDTLKVDNISFRNVILPNFKKEVTDMLEKALKSMNVQVEKVQEKIDNFKTSLVITGVIIPFAIFLVNRYLPKLFNFLKL